MVLKLCNAAYKLLSSILNSPLCGRLAWGDLYYFYSKPRIVIKLICSRWIWVLTAVDRMLSHSLFLEVGESHLLVFLRTFGFEKLLSWMKCLCLVHFISSTQWVSEAHVGKVLHLCCWYLSTFQSKDMKSYLYHPPGLADPFYKVCEMFLVSCLNAFYLSLWYSFMHVSKLDLWRCHEISLALPCYYNKV